MSEEEKQAIEILNNIKGFKRIGILQATETFYEVIETVLNLIEKQNKKIEELEEGIKSGELSDGYHSFNDLYYQRCILFACICNNNSSIAWKSKRHSDGKLCFDSENWFIVGIDTPKGSYTYHYEMKYWELFNVPELEKGKEWDGHTEKDVTRLLGIIKKEDSIPKFVIREALVIANNSLERSRGIYSNSRDKKLYESFNYGLDMGKVEVLKELLGEENERQKRFENIY